MTIAKELNSFKSEKIGFLFAFLASFCYASQATFAKVATEVSPSTLVFFRNLVCFILLMPAFFRNKTSLKTDKIGLYLLRACLGFLTLNTFYYAAKNLKLVDAVTLVNTTPLFIPIVVLIWDRLRIPNVRILAIALGFIGILFIIKPNFQFFNFAGLVGLLSGISMAVSMVTLRKQSRTEPTERILFYFFAGNMLLGIYPMIRSWKSFENPIMWFYIFMVGMLAFLFQVFITKAYTYVSPTKASVISYFSVIFSGIFGWVIWGNVPDVPSFIGILMAVTGGILAMRDKKEDISLKTAKN